MAELDEPVYSIGAAAKILDVPSATLRAWEERYGVITPIRSEGSQRLYSRSQIERLKYIKSQIDAGVSAADAHRLLAQQLAMGSMPAALPDRVAEGRPLILLADKKIRKDAGAIIFASSATTTTSWRWSRARTAAA